MTITGRRGFLKGSLAAMGGGLAAAATGGTARAAGDIKVNEWMKTLGEGVVSRPYGLPSEYESHVRRRWVEWLTATRESSVSFTPIQDLDGIVTPNGLCFERHHGGIAEVDPSEYRLMINGLVEKPLIFTLDDLKRMPRVNRFYFLECAANSGMEWRGAQLNGCQYTHGMIHCLQYTGVALKTVLEQAGIRPNGKWILAEGGDASGLDRSIPIEKALDDCMLAFAMNGEALRPEQGYPVRLVVPGWEGNMWIKWIRRIEVGDEPWHTREETSKYTDLMEDGRSRRFTWIMDAKSVVTSPSPQAPLKYKGINVLSGLAWSGRGKVKRVDVTFDGGRNWVEAELAPPVLSRCLTRFHVNFEWDGRPLLIQSRCIDETGYIQPTKDELRAVRGTNSIYHNNGIQTWHVMASGEVENVEIS